MSNKKVVLGIAAGVAALAVVGLLVTKKKSKKEKFADAAKDAKDNFRSKLQELQRKAKKEFNSAVEDNGSIANKAKERANEWIGKTSN